MKVFNKSVLIFLTIWFIGLNAMEERNVSCENESNEEFAPVTKITKLTDSEPQAQQKQTDRRLKGPLSLKATMALYLLGQINSGKLTWGNLLEFPEGLARFVELFYIVNVYLDVSDEIQKCADDESELEYLKREVEEAKEFLYELIDSETEHVEAFIAALDDFFDWHKDENNEVCYKFGRQKGYDWFGINVVQPLVMMKQFAKGILALEKSKDLEEGIFDLEKSQDLEKCKKIIGCFEQLIPEDISKALEFLASTAVRWNLSDALRLMLNLDLLSRESMISLFESTFKSNCCVQIFRMLSEKIKFTKEELENLLKENVSIFIDLLNKDLESQKYFLELLGNLDLKVAETLSDYSYNIFPKRDPQKSVNYAFASGQCNLQ